MMRPALVLLLALTGAPGLRGQDPRDAQVARAFHEFDPTVRQQLLMKTLDPGLGPLQGAWPVGVQLLAQTFIEDKKDSTAAVWLRWAIRLSPDLQPDSVLFLPEVIAAYRSARGFVARTRQVADSMAVTTWRWPTQTTGEQQGRLQIAAPGPVPTRVEVRDAGGVVAEAGTALKPGSYEISAAAGYDTVRVMREVLPGVVTVLEIRFRSAAAQVVAKPPPAPMPALQGHRKKGFPVMWVGLAAAGTAAVVAYLAAGAAEPPSETGGIVVTFPNP